MRISFRSAGSRCLVASLGSSGLRSRNQLAYDPAGATISSPVTLPLSTRSPHSSRITLDLPVPVPMSRAKASGWAASSGRAAAWWNIAGRRDWYMRLLLCGFSLPRRRAGTTTHPSVWHLLIEVDDQHSPQVFGEGCGVLARAPSLNVEGNPNPIVHRMQVAVDADAHSFSSICWWRPCRQGAGRDIDADCLLTAILTWTKGMWSEHRERPVVLLGATFAVEH